MIHKTITTMSIAAAMGCFAVGSANAAVILADAFTDVVKTSSPATFASGWDTAVGINAPASSLAFADANDTAASSDDSGTLNFHNNGANSGMIDVNNNMTDGGWSTSISLVLDGSTSSIDLTSLSLDIRLTSSTGNTQSTSSKSGRMTAELVGSSSGLLGTIDTDNASYPTSDYNRTLDLTSLPNIDTSETYMLTISALGTGFGHHKALDALTLNGDITAVPEPSSAALLGLGGLALILRRRK
jgi:hypothetical protein